MKKVLRKILIVLTIVTLFNYTYTGLTEESWICIECDCENTENFCTNCGASKDWVCPECKTKNTGNFCGNCGTKKSVTVIEKAYTLTLDWYFIDSVAIDGNTLNISLTARFSQLPDFESIRNDVLGFAQGVYVKYPTIENVVIKYGDMELLHIKIDDVLAIVDDSISAVTKTYTDIGNAVGNAFNEIRYNKLRKFRKRRIENSPLKNKGQGQRHLVE